MQINEALFQANHHHGYILKPYSLLHSSPGSHRPTPQPYRIKLDVKVISGQQIPRPKDYKPGTAVDSYVQVELIYPYGLTTERRTRAVRDNEFNPMWDEKLSFNIITLNREFVFVRYSLWISLTVEFRCIMTTNLSGVIHSRRIVLDCRIFIKVFTLFQCA